jgi:hypothetical protein
MSQRSTQQSGTDCLDSDGESPDEQTIERLKRETAVDLSTAVYVCDSAYDGTYHRKRWGMPGCPNADWNLRETTIEEAIERGDDPCEQCDPPDHRESTKNGEHSTSEGESR